MEYLFRRPVAQIVGTSVHGLDRLPLALPSSFFPKLTLAVCRPLANRGTDKLAARGLLATRYAVGQAKHFPVNRDVKP